jgi:predicted Rossmann-fold nucleotide-binding protein
MTPGRKTVIAVVGANKCSKKLRDMAAEVGRYVAENGGVVVCGGLGGIMEGAARGAKEANGVTIGILPSDNADDANEFIDYVIPTGLGEARNLLVIRTADAIVARQANHSFQLTPGSWGTMLPRPERRWRPPSWLWRWREENNEFGCGRT